jgi:hypothetical protein
MPCVGRLGDGDAVAGYVCGEGGHETNLNALRYSNG